MHTDFYDGSMLYNCRGRARLVVAVWSDGARPRLGTVSYNNWYYSYTVPWYHGTTVTSYTTTSTILSPQLVEYRHRHTPRIWLY